MISDMILVVDTAADGMHLVELTWRADSMVRKLIYTFNIERTRNMRGWIMGDRSDSNYVEKRIKIMITPLG